MKTLMAAGAGLLALGLSGTAGAEGLVHETRVARSVERGVSVWRRAAEPTVAAAAQPVMGISAARCSARVIGLGWPDRGLRTQGFYSGDGLDAGARRAARRFTRGFYSDRMAAGL